MSHPSEPNPSSSSSAPLLSVITVSFNAMQTLPQTIASVANQSYLNIEQVVVDGGSTDGTVNYLSELGHPHLRWISEKDHGIYDAMNKGLLLARGEVVAFLNADDCYFPDTANNVMSAFDDQTDIVYGDMRKERFLNGRWYHRFEKPNLSLMPQTMGVFHPATFIRRELFDRLGTYDTRYRLSADYEWLLRAYLANVQFKYLAKPLAVFRVGGVSTLNCQSYEEGLAILEKHRTGYEKQMEALVRKCRRKVFSHRLIRGVTRLTATESLLEKRMSKNWIPNHGDFGT